VRSLKRSEDFRRVRERGSRARRDGLTVFVAPGAAVGMGSRVGITVPGTVGGAVTRNRLRRRLRAAFDRIDTHGERDMVVRADAGAAQATFHELEEDLRMALSRANRALRDG
jgi:ribonuclease P protein component